ncbi:MAG: RRXRR domain-containing protein [Clostridia bacterium]|nr:RRXRR domain-containing protein [Clostridia bacterium]
MEVISVDGQPLIPTERYGRVWRLLKSGRAKAIMSKPFTIQLLYESGTVIRPIDLGADAET